MPESKQNILDSFKYLKKKLGRTPKANDDLFLRNQAYKVFGSWSNLLKEAGEPYPGKVWTQQELVEQYRALKEDIGCQPTRSDDDALAHRAIECPELGSWNALVAAAGDTPKRKGPQPRTASTLERVLA